MGMCETDQNRLTASSVLGTRAARLHMLRRGMIMTLIATLTCAFLGQLVRDRARIFFIPFYLPLLPLGLFTIAVDLLLRGRGFLRPRFGLACIGLGTTILGASQMVAFGTGRAPTPTTGSIRLLHWNVFWGGGMHAAPANWESLIATMQSQHPDVIVLSEAPPDAWREQMLTTLGSDWNAVHCVNPPGQAYWYNQVVAARWPVRLEYEGPIFNGRLMDITIDAPQRPLRLLIVDGQSNPFEVSRVQMLADVYAHCKQLESAGIRVDALVGDFNTSPRSVAFDEMATLTGGYRLASPSSRGWRGTWPALLPLFEIDHIWIHRANALHDAGMFTNLNSDHRGQVVTFSRP